MKATEFVFKATSVAVMTVFSCASFGHAEHDKPRYISPTGVDKGYCDAIDKPCRSFRYTAGHSNKGDRILVAAGDYQITDPDSLFYLISDIVPVKAGFSPQDKYTNQDAASNVTRLNGIPVKYAERLRKQGFVVNTDLKGMSDEARASLQLKLEQFESLGRAQSGASCVDGHAAGYSCHNVDLLAHIPLSEFGLSGASGNDIWGYIDLNTGREYAIIGLTKGYSVVDVTTPTEPQIVGTVAAQSTIWRDIKVHQFYDSDELRWKAYAYITADNAAVGLTVVDLNDLANGISVVNVDKTDISAHNVFLSNVDYSTGVALTGMEAVLHLAGANNGQGAFNSYSLSGDSKSVSPLYRPGMFASYTHDVSSMVVKDDRIQSQCTPKNGLCEIFFDYNVDDVKLWDKTENSTPKVIGTITYPNSQYIHSGWTTEDGKYVFVHDELDEVNNGTRTTVRVFDISDMNHPHFAGSWVGPTYAIDHNGFVRGNRYYMSSYERGLEILDISNPANPVSVGNFDTFPVSDNTAFHGAWGVYPYLPSGNIIVSDINSGLYILGDRTVGTDSNDSVRFDASRYEVDEGGNVVVNVERVGDPKNAVTVRYETQAGSALADDFGMTQGTLSWAAGDTEAKQIVVSANDDALDDEYTETFFVRLYSPTDGLSLASPSISTVDVKGLALPTYAAFTASTLEVKETDGTVTIPVSRSGNINSELTVGYEVVGGTATNGSDFQLNADSLHWASGDSGTKEIELSLLNDGQSEGLESIVLKLSQTTGGSELQEISLTIRDDDANLAPEVTVSEDQTVEAGASVSLAATASDPEGYPLTYLWSQTSGQTVTIGDESASSIGFTAPNQEATLTFEVTVTDDFGVSTSQSVTVGVAPPGSPTSPSSPQPTTSNSGGSSGGAIYLLPVVGLLGVFRRRRAKSKTVNAG